jgi:predicted RNA polymerase sigma factor
VLEVVYLIFNEGCGERGRRLIRPALCEEGSGSGASCGLAPEELEVHGLVALMEIRPRSAARGLAASPSCSP